MIELYTAPTGNGFRAAIAVAESGLPFAARVIDLGAGEQREAWFRDLNPLVQIPVIIDRDRPDGKSVTISQSGTIMLYLAEKCGRLLPASGLARVRVLERFMQVCTDIAAINATLTLATNKIAAPDAPTIAYFERILHRHFTMLDRLLTGQSWLADDVSIADLSLYPHTVRRAALIDQWGLTHLARWRERMAQRPGVQLGMSIPITPNREDHQCLG